MAARGRSAPRRALARQLRELHGGRWVGDQRTESSAVGAQGIGQDERVEPVVLVAGGAVPAAKAVHLVGADHPLLDVCAAESADELAQPGIGRVDELVM